MTAPTLIIDGTWLARRHYEAGRTARHVVRAVVRVRDRLRPWCTIVVWDHPDGCAWRRKLLPAYKPRDPHPPEFDAMLADLPAPIAALGCLQATSPHGEGDDVVASLVRGRWRPCVVWSVDKDFLQLVAPGVELLWASTQTRAEMLVTADNCADVTGWPASCWPLWQALTGDPTDGVPGCRGYGPVRAGEVMRGERPLPTGPELGLQLQLVTLRTVPVLLTPGDADAGAVEHWLLGARGARAERAE